MKDAAIDARNAKLAILAAYEAAHYTLIPVCSPVEPHQHAGRPCKSQGKVPTIANWATTGYGTFPAAKLVDGNYGVSLQADDIVIDVDPRNFPPNDNPLKRLIAVIGAVKTFVVQTGGGGLHIYLKKPADLQISQGLREYPGIEFKTAGRQVVGPGSFHASSQAAYKVNAGAPTEVSQASEALLNLLQRPAAPLADLQEVGTGAYVNDAGTQGIFVAYLKDNAEVSVEGKRGDENAFVVACHGRDLGLPPASVLELMLSDWNPRCQPPWEAGELKAKVLNAYRYAKKAVGNAHPSAAFDAILDDINGAPAAKPADGKISWVMSDNGAPKKCFQNLLNFMRVPEGGLAKIFAKNEFTGRIEFANPAPWHRGALPAARGVTDHDIDLLKGFLATRHGYDAGAIDIAAAITNVAYHNRFHPVREYLESLKWDGVKRIDTWLETYLGAVADGAPGYLQAISRKVLCAAVMRVMRPGIKFDHVLVLEGPQDLGKSSAIEILGGPYSSDAPVDPHSRDTVDAMQGRWFIEMAEMEVVRKQDGDALKAFITRRVDRVRLAFGRATVDLARQSIFIATKNPESDGAYLKDPTGARRWWPVYCNGIVNPKTHIRQIDFRGLKDVRDQLFAEAMVVVKTPPGEPLYMETTELKTQARIEAAHRQVEHPWSDRIGEWIAQIQEKPETRRAFLTVREVYIEAMGGHDSHLGRRETLAIASILRSMGWEQGYARKFGHLTRGWHAPFVPADAKKYGRRAQEEGAVEAPSVEAVLAEL